MSECAEALHKVLCQFDRIDSVMKPKRPDRILNFKSVKLLKNENINFKWLFIARLEMALLKGSLSKGSIPGDSRLLRAFPSGSKRFQAARPVKALWPEMKNLLVIRRI